MNAPDDTADRRPWLAHYDPGIPSTLAPYPDRPIFEYLRDAARERPRHPAVVFKGRAISCGDLDALSDAFAAALADLGVRKGDRVALLLPNSPQFLIAELGAWKAGAVVVPLNPIYTAHELEMPLTDSGAEIVIALSSFYTRVKQAQTAATHIRRVIVTNIKEYLPRHLRVLFTIFRERREGHRVRLQTGDLRFADLIERHRGSSAPRVTVSAADPAVLLLSGGTTGTPKAVPGMHGALVAAGLQLHAWAGLVCRDWDDVILLPLPLFHVYANAGVQPFALIGHNPLALVPNPRDTNDLVSTIARVKPAFLGAVPALFIAMLNHPKVQRRKVDFSSVKLSFSGASALLADTKQRFESLTGGRIIEGYSLTEAMMACTVNPVRGQTKDGSVGMPLPDVEVMIVDSESGETRLGPGETGEVIVRAPQVMPSYWRNPGETTAALRTHGPGGAWLHTGDLGYLDADGYLFLVDRKKDLIKASGFQVWPREIEEVLAAHPAIADVGVAGVPDADRGEMVKAWVVLRAGHSATEAELRAYCKERIAPFKVPRAIEFRTHLPKSMIGKVLRRKLIEEEHRVKS
jgi:long-chain acyl-CoA synthetase